MLSEREEKFEFIRVPEPEEEIPSFHRSASYKSVSEKIVDEFLKADVRRAEVKVPKGQDIRGLVRGLGKILKRKQLQNKFGARISTDRKLWLFKRE